MKSKTISAKAQSKSELKQRIKELEGDYKSINKLTWVQPRECKSYSLDRASGLIALTEILILLATGGFIYWYYVGWGGIIHEYYGLAIFIPSFTVVASFHLTGLYDINSICNPWSQTAKVLGILAVNFLTFLALAFAMKVSVQFSRIWVFSWFLSSAYLIFLNRIYCHSILMRWAKAGRVSRKIAIIGAGEQAKRFLGQLQRANEPWNNLVGIFDERKARIGPSFLGVPVLGNINALLNFVRKNRVDDVIITLPWNADKRIMQIISKIEELPVHVRLGSDLAGFLRLRPSYSSISGVPILDVVDKPLDGWKYALKMAEDKILGLFFIVMFLPLMLLVTLAIKLESNGPVFFRQKRYGFNNKEFTVFKFRSMYHQRPPDNGVPQAKRNDPRVTRVGAFIRKTSLDELPQLFNVLNGTMSVVGPRPHAVVHNEEYSKIIGGYFARHRVKPGITGWAQVNGYRGETNSPDMMKARVEHDVEYIDNWSLMFDITILVMTVPILFYRHKNAY